MLLALEKVWALWQLKPFQNSEARTIRKESKYYVLDWIFDDFFETKVAISLMKRVTILRQITGKKYEFFFYRDYHEREVDFIITLNQKPILAIEAKETEQNIPSALQYFCKTYKCPGIVLTKNLTQLDFKNNFIICGFDRFARAYL
jgi:predicted AAA+ superfamily ATPase